MSEPPAKRPTFSTKLSGMAFMRRGLPKDLAPVVEPEVELAVLVTVVGLSSHGTFHVLQKLIFSSRFQHPSTH